MRTLPDYSFETMPAEYAALVLIGGFGWMNPEAERVLPIVKDALSKGVVVGAICNAASWMAKQGLLKLLENDTPEMINGWYTFMSDGLVKCHLSSFVNTVHKMAK